MIDENIVVKVLFFAHLKDLAKTRQVEMKIPPHSNINQLKERLTK
jgi:molybdopterin converting factor small subunit